MTEIIKKRHPSEIALGFFLLSHPGPVLLHIIGVTLFALLAALPHPVWGVVALVIAAHTAMQLSIATLNDYCDRQLDAASKPSKPIPRGLVRPREALIAGILLVVIMVALLLPLNRLALFISLAYLALGQGYNLGLKSTPMSGIIFALANRPGLFLAKSSRTGFAAYHWCNVIRVTGRAAPPGLGSCRACDCSAYGYAALHCHAQ